MVKATVSWIVLLGGITATVSAVAQYASTIRAPAYPLAVRQPYVSTWLEADSLPGNWPTFWLGSATMWDSALDYRLTYPFDTMQDRKNKRMGRHRTS